MSTSDKDRSQTKTPPQPSELPVPTTPLRRSSAVLSHHSSHHVIPVIPQRELQDALRSELLGATFESNELSNGNSVSHKAISEIKCHLPTWPSEGGESAYYDPVLKTINAVRNVLKKHRGSHEHKAAYDNHTLFVYADRAMMDSVESAHPLKPDLILTRRTELGENDRVRWRDVDVVIEVKRDWSDLITQAATYARALFYSNWTRQFSLVLGVNYKSRRTRFMFFHRGGLTSTPELVMDGQEPEFPKFVQMLDTVFSWKPEGAGFLSTASHNNPFGDLSLLSSRTSVRGRANQVAILSRMENIDPQHPETTSTEQTKPPLRRSPRLLKKAIRQVPQPKTASSLLPGDNTTVPVIATPQDKTGTTKKESTAEKDARPRNREALADACAIYEYGNLDHRDSAAEGRIPSRLVYKDSWPLLRDSNLEVNTYAPVKGEFGVPSVWAFQRLGDNLRFVDGAEAWDAFTESVPAREPEQRIHMRLYYSTVGKPLDTCRTPYQLIECILHAMIGHFNLLRKSKALHRDVSEGNILVVDEPVTGVEVFNELFGSSFESLPTRCRGILIDGDLAKPISDRDPPEPGDSISGTLPFMSINLLNQWTYKSPIYHNPHDDLESGVWVALVCGLEQFTKYNATDVEKAWLEGLVSHRVEVVAKTKFDIALFHKPPQHHPFYGLIVKWFGLLVKRVKEDNFGAERPVSVEDYFMSYQEFLREGFTWLKTYGADLDKNWHDFDSEDDSK